MINIRATNRGNIVIDGTKYYAVPWHRGGCNACALQYECGATTEQFRCGTTHRPESWRLPQQEVFFVTKEQYAEYKASVASTKEEA